jgi:hypothetical protein
MLYSNIDSFNLIVQFMTFLFLKWLKISCFGNVFIILHMVHSLEKETRQTKLKQDGSLLYTK